MDIEAFESSLTQVETGFNKLGAVPLLGAFSGAARTLCAKVQIAVAAVFLLIGLVGLCVSSSSEEPKKQIELGLNHILHGALNYTRGIAEFTAGATILGSLGILAIHILGRKTEAGQSAFRPFFEYKTVVPVPQQI
jgi:ABC-type sulfate transport system permease component